MTPDPLTPSPDSPTSSDAITLHIKCDPNLTNDDSDELVVHILPEGRVMLEIYQGPGLGTNYVMTVLESIPAMQLKTFIGEMSYEHQKALVHISELESDLRFSADVNEKLDRVITHLEDGLKRIKTRSCFSECVNVADRVLRETREQLAAARTQCELRSAGHDDLRTKLNQANGQLRQLRATLAERDREMRRAMDQHDYWQELAGSFESQVNSLRAQLAEMQLKLKEAEKAHDQLTERYKTTHDHWIAAEERWKRVQQTLIRVQAEYAEREESQPLIEDKGAELLALQAHVEKLRAALGYYLTTEYYMTAEVALASQPDLTLIEEVRGAVEYAIKAADCDDNHKKWEQFTQLLARLNPRK